jgi:hypothetical protein
MILKIPDHVWAEMRATAQKTADDVMRSMLQEYVSNFVDVTTLDDAPGTTTMQHVATGRLLTIKATWDDSA